MAVEKTALSQAEAAIRTHGEQVKGRESQVAIARLTVGYATLAAPADGYVTKKAVEVGNQIQAGQPLMAVVSLSDLSVIANYKETQVHAIRPGQPVRIKVDALPEREFTGRVQSVMAGTGAAFSLFPPENASGNYVKVVQRIPVKIVLDPNQGAEEVLRVGMSVNPTILARNDGAEKGPRCVGLLAASPRPPYASSRPLVEPPCTWHPRVSLRVPVTRPRGDLRSEAGKGWREGRSPSAERSEPGRSAATGPAACTGADGRL